MRGGDDELSLDTGGDDELSLETVEEVDDTPELTLADDEPAISLEDEDGALSLEDDELSLETGWGRRTVTRDSRGSGTTHLS